MKSVASEQQHIIQSPTLTEDTKLYRYISLSEFMSFVETKQASFSRIKNGPDTWEALPAKLPVQFGDDPVTHKHYHISESMFGQCWCLDEESDAMWRIYSPQNEGVVIQTSVKNFRLLRDIKFAALGRVIYYDDPRVALDQSHKHKEFGIFTDAFLKRRAFAHENEVRFVTMDDARCLVQRPLSGASYLGVDLDPRQFIEGIKIDPRANNRYVETLRKYCERSGFTIEPIKSRLYGDPYQTGLVIKYVKVKKSE